MLPFVNLSDDRENEYFSDGLAEQILNDLARVEGIKVVGRTSSFAFKGRKIDLRAIGKELGVAHILEGSVRKAGNRVRISAQLVSAVNGLNLWSASYDRELTDVFATPGADRHASHRRTARLAARCRGAAPACQANPQPRSL